MLKLSDVAPEHAFTRRIDAYVPLDLEISPGPVSADELYYWRSKGSAHLLEIRVAAASGILGAVSLVLVPRAWVRAVDAARISNGVERRFGLPIVELEPWKPRTGGREIGVDPALRRIDEDLPFSVLIGQDGIAVRFHSGDPTSMVSNGDLDFLFTASRELHGIALGGLSSAELRSLRTSGSNERRYRRPEARRAPQARRSTTQRARQDEQSLPPDNADWLRFQARLHRLA